MRWAVLASLVFACCGQMGLAAIGDFVNDDITLGRLSGYPTPTDNAGPFKATITAGVTSANNENRAHTVGRSGLLCTGRRIH